MKNSNYFNSDLNEFVHNNCRKNIVVMDIDMCIRYYDDNNKIRFIEKKHLNESLGKGQKISLIELTKHNLEAFVLFGNKPYLKDNYLYSLHTFNLYKIDGDVFTNFANNHLKEGELRQYKVAHNKHLLRLKDSVRIKSNRYTKMQNDNDFRELVPPNDFTDDFPSIDADYFPSSELDFDAYLPTDVMSSPINKTDSRAKRNYNDNFQEKDIVRILMLYGSQYFQIKQNGAIEEWNVATYVLSNMEEVIEAFDNLLYQRIVNMIYENLEEEIIYTIQDFLEHKDKKVKRLAIELSMSPHEYSETFTDKFDKHLATQPMLDENFKTDIVTGINIFKIKKLQSLYEKNQKDLKNLSADDVQDMMRLLKVQQRLMDARKSIAEKTSTIILN